MSKVEQLNKLIDKTEMVGSVVSASAIDMRDLDEIIMMMSILWSEDTNDIILYCTKELLEHLKANLLNTDEVASYVGDFNGTAANFMVDYSFTRGEYIIYIILKEGLKDSLLMPQEDIIKPENLLIIKYDK